MLDPILTPDLRAYLTAILVVYGLGANALALHLASSWSIGEHVSYGDLRNITLAFAACVGLLIVHPGTLLAFSPAVGIAAVPIGAAAGWVSGQADRAVIRHFRRRRINPAASPRTMSSRTHSLAPTGARVMRVHPLGGHPAAQPREGSRRFRPSEEEQQVHLAPILVGAILEELIFRGLLLQVCFWLANGAMTVSALGALIALFGLSHIRFGWDHVVAKLPLGILTTMAAVSLGTVVPAIIAHLIFNLDVWRQRQRQPVHAGFAGSSTTGIPHAIRRASSERH